LRHGFKTLFSACDALFYAMMCKQLVNGCKKKVRKNMFYAFPAVTLRRGFHLF
jgi:hypothetical protein